MNKLTLKSLKMALAPKGFSVRRNYYSGEYTLYPRGGKLVHGERAFTYESPCLSDILKTAQNSFFKSALRGYLECALWAISEYDENGKCLGNLNENFEVEDIAFSALLQSARDLKGFIGLCDAENSELIAYYVSNLAPKGYDGADHFGYDFFLTRNGHGTGFWDRGNYKDEKDQKIGRKLTEFAKTFGSADFYVDDKREKIYVC